MASKRDRPAERDVGGLYLGPYGHRLAGAVGDVRRESGPTLRDRVYRVRCGLILAMQAALAAGLAWWVAGALLRNPDPVFAPIAAVGTLAASFGQRIRRTVQLIIGVAVGIGVGSGLVFVLGSGPWQLAVVVLLAITVTIFLGGGPAVVTQAAATAVLLVALTPKTPNLELTRAIDALVGGFVSLAVALLLPFDPLRVVDRAARPAAKTLTDQLAETAAALADRDPDRAQRALDRLQVMEKQMQGCRRRSRAGGRLRPSRRCDGIAAGR